MREAATHLLRLLVNRPGFLAHPAVRAAAAGAVRRLFGLRAPQRPAEPATDFHAVAPHLGTLATVDGPDDVGARRRRRPVAPLPATRRGG